MISVKQGHDSSKELLKPKKSIKSGKISTKAYLVFSKDYEYFELIIMVYITRIT